MDKVRYKDILMLFERGREKDTERKRDREQSKLFGDCRISESKTLLMLFERERERERVLATYRRVRIIPVILGVKLLADVPGPRPEGAYVEGQGILVRGRCQREGVVLVGPMGQTCDPNPLPGLVVEVRWSFELDVGNI